MQEIPVSALQQLTESYPFFAAGQFLLAKKLGQTGSESFEDQLQKTAVYFHDPLWLEYLMNKEDAGTGSSRESSESQHTDLPVQQPGSEKQASASEQTAGQASLETGQQPAEEKKPFPDYKQETLTVPETGNPQDEDDLPPDETDYVQADMHETQPLLRKFMENTPETDTIEYQAYHTIDYFASLGIYLPHGDQPADKLGKQLKSFTDWLKTMRRLPAAGKLQQMGHVNEQAIYEQALHSLKEKEIVTETMAEVLVKQENTGKAIEIYYKLGLLNPSKKAYFAAKIQALK